MIQPVTLNLIVILCLCAFVNAEVHSRSGCDDDTNSRLTRLEMTLETVLEHNKKLEQRLEALEDENQAMKKLLSQPLTRIADSKEVSVTKKLSHRFNQLSGKNRGNIFPANDVKIKPRRQLNAATVAFTVVVTPPSLTNVGAGQIVRFDGVVTNVGNAYHRATGIFTAPVSGVYVFSFSVMIDPGNDEYMDLVKDGKHVIANYGHASNANHVVSSSRTATVELKTGEEVWVRTSTSSHHGTGIIHGNGYTTFSGWLIFITE